MAIIDTVKKGYMYLKTSSGYTKLLPRTYASLVSLNDGGTLTVKDQIDSYQSRFIDRQVFFYDDSNLSGSASFSLQNLISDVKYSFIVTVSSSLSNESYKQEITCKLGNTVIGQNGNYYKLTSAFSGICEKGNTINISSYKNGGSWSQFNVRVTCIPFQNT